MKKNNKFVYEKTTAQVEVCCRNCIHDMTCVRERMDGCFHPRRRS